MKFNLIFLLVLILFSKQAVADMGSCLCFNATITTTSGESHTGYFKIASYNFYYEKEQHFISVKVGDEHQNLDINLLKDSTTFVLTNPEYDFTEFILKENYFRDSIILYSDMALTPLQYYDTVLYESPTLFGNRIGVLPEEVKHIKINFMNSCGIGEGVYTAIEKKDVAWINRVNYKFSELLGSVEICDYLFVSFSDETKQSKLAKEELRALLQTTHEEDKRTGYDTVEKNELLLKEKIQELKKHKVIIARFCSC